jgi:hypothetical protein
VNELEWIQQWYQAQCDGNWEHAHGIKIDTLDNPGWAVTVDLKGTPLAQASMETLFHDRGPGDWIRFEVKDAQFLGHGDPNKLSAILAAFREWVLRATV